MSIKPDYHCKIEAPKDIFDSYDERWRNFSNPGPGKIYHVGTRYLANRLIATKPSRYTRRNSSAVWSSRQKENMYEN